MGAGRPRWLDAVAEWKAGQCCIRSHLVVTRRLKRRNADSCVQLSVQFAVVTIRRSDAFGLDELKIAPGVFGTTDAPESATLPSANTWPDISVPAFSRVETRQDEPQRPRRTARLVLGSSTKSSVDGASGSIAATVFAR